MSSWSSHPSEIILGNFRLGWIDPLTRIFSTLAVLSLLLLGANFVIGLSIGDFNQVAKDYSSAYREFTSSQTNPDLSNEQKVEIQRRLDAAKEKIPAPRQKMTIHFFLGVASSLMAVLVNSITVTYFIGTSRWCREVVETYALPPELSQQSATLKRRTFPYALMGMLTVLGIVTLGALSDPSVPWNKDRSYLYVTPHYLAAMAGTAFLAFLFWIQASRMADNYAVIQEIMRLVDLARGRGGEFELPPSTSQKESL